MNDEKFNNEVRTLNQFFELNCKRNHNNLSLHCKQLIYNNKKINTELYLCKDCIELIHYSFDRLLECPHDPKPMCRSCKNPCYEKDEWKKVAKVMRYSGVELGLIKVKNFFKKIKKPFS